MVHARFYLSSLNPFAANEVGVAIKSTYAGSKVLYGGDKPNFTVTVVSAPAPSDIQSDEPAPEPEPEPEPEPADDYLNVKTLPSCLVG